MKEGYDHPSLTAIKFGQSTRLRREEKKKEDEALRKLGFKGGADELRKYASLMHKLEAHGISPEQIEEKLFGQRKSEPGPVKELPKELPKEAAGNVSARMEKAKQNYRSAPKQQYVTVGRSVHIASSRIRDDARTYLRAKYESGGEMFCQLCQKATPFLARDGHGYFEATQVFARMHRDVTEQFLSFCPQCSAKYDEWIRRSDARAQSLKRSILAHRPAQGEESVRIPLPGESENGVKSPLSGKTLYFTGTHFVDLRQAVFENEEMGGLDDSPEPAPGEVAEGSARGFVDWYASYDKVGKLAFYQISKALSQAEACRRRNNERGVVMWKASLEGEIKKVMAFWLDYHKAFPSGESEAEARLSLERHCRTLS